MSDSVPQQALTAPAVGPVAFAPRVAASNPAGRGGTFGAHDLAIYPELMRTAEIASAGQAARGRQHLRFREVQDLPGHIGGTCSAERNASSSASRARPLASGTR